MAFYLSEIYSMTIRKAPQVPPVDLTPTPSFDNLPVSNRATIDV